MCVFCKNKEKIEKSIGFKFDFCQDQEFGEIPEEVVKVLLSSLYKTNKEQEELFNTIINNDIKEEKSTMCNCQNCKKIDEHFSKVLLKSGISHENVKNMLSAFQLFRGLSQEAKDELFNVELDSVKEQTQSIIDDINKDLDKTFGEMPSNKKEEVKSSNDDKKQAGLSIKVVGLIATVKLSGTFEDRVKIALALANFLKRKDNDDFLSMFELAANKD